MVFWGGKMWMSSVTPVLDPEDVALIATMPRPLLLELAEQEEAWADHLVRVGRWPSDRNGRAVALWRERAAACRRAADVLQAKGEGKADGP